MTMLTTAALPDDTDAAAALVSHLFAPVACRDVLAAAERAGFRAADYWNANPDLHAAFRTADRAALHFLAVAKTERRRFPIELDMDGLRALHALPARDRTQVSGVLAALADACLARADEPFTDMLDRVWPHLPALRRLGAHPYVLVGDSHSMLYRRSAAWDGTWLLPLHLCCTGGSAIGLMNPLSRSGYRLLIQSALQGIGQREDAGDTKARLPHLFQFGQVDLEFVHPFRRLAAGQHGFAPAEFEEFCHHSVTAYIGFLAELFPRSQRPLADVLAVFPPALSDAALQSGYVNGHVALLEGEQDLDALARRLRGLEWPDLASRTRMHAEYNATLTAAAAEAGFHVASDFAQLLDGDTVAARFTAIQGGRDHHLDFEPTAPVLNSTLQALVTRDRTVPLPKPGRRPGTSVLGWVRRKLQDRAVSSTAAGISFADLSEELDPALLPPLDRPGVDDARLTPEQRSWRRDGVLVLERFLPTPLVDAYITRRMQHPDPAGWSLPTPYLHLPELRALALYPPLMAMMKSLIGEPMLLHLALTGWRSTQRAWHQDDYLNPPFVANWYAAAWMALDGITPECGPFEYLPGSHRWPLLRLEKVKSFLTPQELARREPVSGNNEWPKYAERFVTPAVEQQIAASGLQPRSFLGRKGDVMIWHGRLMHQGSAPSHPEAERRSLITHYSGINHRPDMPNRVRDLSGAEYAYFDHPLQ